MYNPIYMGSATLVTGSTGLDVLHIDGSFSEVWTGEIGYIHTIASKYYPSDGGPMRFATQVERATFDGKLVALDVFGDAPANTGYIYKLYQVAFDRDADTAGLSYWTAFADAHGRQNSAQIAEEFISSAEFVAFNDQSNEDIVSRLYESAFDREADAAGLEYWTEYLDNGGSVAVVLEGFASSQEMADKYAVELSGGLYLDLDYFPPI